MRYKYVNVIGSNKITYHRAGRIVHSPYKEVKEVDNINELLNIIVDMIEFELEEYRKANNNVRNVSTEFVIIPYEKILNINSVIDEATGRIDDSIETGDNSWKPRDYVPF